MWRAENPNTKEYTWRNTDHTIRTRIDRIYTPTNLKNQTTTKITTCPYSDHDVVLTTIKNQGNPRGPGVWKLNVKLLKDKWYINEIKNLLELWSKQQNNDKDPASTWDDLKETIKRISIKHSIRKAKERRDRKEKLTNEVNALLQAQHPEEDKIKKKEQELKQIMDQEAEGQQIRSRAKWTEQGEKPTRYFYGLEKTRQKSSTIDKLKKENEVITNDIDILETARDFYQRLYTAEPTNLDDQKWLLQHIEKKLTNEERQDCEGPMKTKETTKAAQELNNNKAPGPDGIPVEFYKHFWNQLMQPLTDLYNYNYDNEAMTESQQSAILRLLYKKKDKERLKNWRPISLLNTDYKIAAKVIANRLKPVLDTIIHEDQTCGIPGRTIYENIFKLRDIVHHTHRNKHQVILISLDQEKAFDRVDRIFLEKTLNTMNFGPSFNNWIRTLYFNANATITNNGWFSDPVKLMRGLRQGCPLSPLLYVLVAETLGQAIRQDPHIKGTHIPGGNGETDKLTQYADDATLILKDELSVLRSFDIIGRYEQGSGSKLNYEKSEGIYIGNQEGRNTGPVPITWKTDYIKVLGTQIGPTMEQDWETPTKKSDKRLQGWASRSLTIYGRALILRTFALANFIFLATSFQIPEKLIIQMQRKIFTYLWKGQTEYVKRETMYLPLKEGGLAIPDLRKANTTTKMKWIRMIGNKDYQKTWVKWPRYYIGTSLSTIKTQWSFLRSNMYPHADPGNQPPWYHIVERTTKKYAKEIGLMNEEEITNKNLQTLLNQDNDQPRANGKWKRENIAEEEMEQHWKELWFTPNVNKEKERMWRLTHGILPTISKLKKWKMVKEAKCPYCKQEEDEKHVFKDCERNKKLWDYVTHLMEGIKKKKTILNFVEIIFHTTTTEPTERNLLKFLTTTAANIIWETREKKLRKEAEPDLTEEFRRRVKERINYDLMNNKRSNILWSHNDTLIKYDGQKIMYIL